MLKKLYPWNKLLSKYFFGFGTAAVNKRFKKPQPAVDFPYSFEMLFFDRLCRATTSTIPSRLWPAR
jgi:hypothetical protein